MLENSFTINDMAKGCSRYLKCGHILTFRRESGWTAGCYGKTSGRDLKRSCRESRVTRGARPGTIGASLRRFSGSCGRGVPGVIFRRSWATGTGHSSASPAGDKRASGNGWQRLARRCRPGEPLYRFDHCASPPTFGRCPKKDGHQEIGRSRGGLTTKLHVAVDALGNPLRVILSAGQVADIEHAGALISLLCMSWPTRDTTRMPSSN